MENVVKAERPPDKVLLVPANPVERVVRFMRDVFLIIGALAMIGCVFFLLNIAGSNRELNKANHSSLTAIQANAKDTKKSLDILEEQTSTKAQQRQADTLHAIVVTVDCRFQNDIKRAIELLQSNNLTPEQAAKLISDECKAQGGGGPIPDTAPDTTASTTLPGG